MTNPIPAGSAAGPPLALSRLRVLDLSRLAPGPYCTMLLGDLGADVLVIDDARDVRAARAEPADALRDETALRRAASDATLRRNKRSLALNLKTDAARQVFYRLADEADIVLEGFRPGVVTRLGVDYDTLATRNPRLIYCSLSGYGQTGPYAGHVGHDINYIATAGALAASGSDPPGPEGPSRPAIPLNLLADFAGGGLMAAFAILAAVVAREETGRGQYIDLAMSDGVLSLLTAPMAAHFAIGADLAPRSYVLNGGAPYYDVYRTADDRWFSLGAVEPKFFANFCAAVGREDLIPLQNDDAPAARARLRDELAAIFRTRGADEWFALLTQTDVCAAPVLTPAEAAADPHNRAREMILDVPRPDGSGETMPQIGIAAKLGATPGRVRAPAPGPGRDTDAVLRALGMDDAAIAALRESGAVA
jgi:crotonobetainyl-CoA:carnitine CoA-transferase CaiB-like acyl-CoA transferase